MIAWKYLISAAAIAAILKPMLAYPKKIKAYGSILTGYRGLEHDLHEIKIMISQTILALHVVRYNNYKV